MLLLLERISFYLPLSILIINFDKARQDHGKTALIFAITMNIVQRSQKFNYERVKPGNNNSLKPFTVHSWSGWQLSVTPHTPRGSPPQHQTEECGPT